jgi:hypothetical protein
MSQHLRLLCGTSGDALVHIGEREDFTGYQFDHVNEVHQQILLVGWTEDHLEKKHFSCFSSQFSKNRDPF